MTVRYALTLTSWESVREFSPTISQPTISHGKRKLSLFEAERR